MPTSASDWPLGLNHEFATIDAEAVRECLGPTLAFSRGHDDLAGFAYALFEADGEKFALQLYDNIPTGDFTLVRRPGGMTDLESLAAFLRWSRIPEAAVKWVRPAALNESSA